MSSSNKEKRSSKCEILTASRSRRVLMHIRCVFNSTEVGPRAHYWPSPAEGRSASGSRRRERHYKLAPAATPMTRERRNHTLLPTLVLILEILACNRNERFLGHGRPQIRALSSQGLQCYASLAAYTLRALSRMLDFSFSPNCFPTLVLPRHAARGKTTLEPPRASRPAGI